MTNSLKKKKGFTIIELLVVIVVLGILVLLALPWLLGHTENARIAHIKNDIKAHETTISAERAQDNSFIDGWAVIDSSLLEAYRDSGSLYNKRGIVEDSEEFNDEYFAIQDNLVNSHLKGDFILAEDGEVYYYENAVEVSACPEYTMADDEDFLFVESSDGYSYEVNGVSGYFHYVGSDECVEIPHTIQGFEMTSYSSMFNNTEGIKGVKSTNENIEVMAYMFKEANLPDLDISQLNLLVADEMSGMFQDGNFENASFDLTGFDGNDLQTNVMFAGSTIKNVNMSNVELNSLSAYSMFRQTKANNINMSGLKIESSVGFGGAFSESDIHTLSLKNSVFNDNGDLNNLIPYAKAEHVDLSGIEGYKIQLNSSFSSSEIKTIDMSNMQINEAGLNGMFGNLKSEEVDISSSSMIKAELNNAFSNANVDLLNAENLIANDSAMNGMLSNLTTNKINMKSGLFDGAQMHGALSISRANEIDASGSSFNGIEVAGLFGDDTEIEKVIFTNISMNDSETYSFFGDISADLIDISNSSLNNSLLNGFLYGVKAKKIDLMNSNLNDSDLEYFMTNSEVDTLILDNVQAKRTNMGSVFSGATVQSISADMFDTEGSTSMIQMFRNSAVDESILSKLNTSSVTNMTGMFFGVNEPLLDLSTFDFSNVEITEGILQNSSAEIVYVSNEAFKVLLDESIGKPEGLNVMVK